MRGLCIGPQFRRALQWSSSVPLLVGVGGGVYANDQSPHGSLYELCSSRLVQCTACATAVWAASKSDKEDRIEDNDGVDSRLGRCQDVTRRMMRPSTVRGNFGREVRGQFLVN